MVAVQKEGMAPLQGTDKMLLAVHNKKTRPREGCGQGKLRKNTISQAWDQPLLNYRGDLSQAVIYWATTLFQTQS